MQEQLSMLLMKKPIERSASLETFIGRYEPKEDLSTPEVRSMLNGGFKNRFDCFKMINSMNGSTKVRFGKNKGNRNQVNYSS